MGREDSQPDHGKLDVSGDFPVVSDRSVSEERQRHGFHFPLKRPEEVVITPPALHAGQLIAGKYRLKRTIGEGGMGLVWIALNEDLHVDVAIKVLRPESRKSVRAQVADRMLVEARAAARLGHPAIVRVLDLGRTDDGDPFLVMELLEGENLADVVEQRGPMDAVEAVRTLLPIAHALVAAHEKKIIHRDLKPENIILAAQQGGAIQPKLIDFGVAKVSADSADKITQMGMLVGSPGYMSPEQGRGDPVDARSDVWSLCIVLHELVTGQVPFRKNHPYAILRAILEDQLPNLAEAGFRDESLAEIVRRGLEKEPEDRWQSMHELGVTLARWLVEKGVFDDICGASLDVTWFRVRMSMPDGLATFRERSPSLSALAKMRETTRETPTPEATKPAESTAAPKVSSEPPVALGPPAPSLPPPLPRNGSLRIAAFAIAAALVVVGVVVYSLRQGAPPATATAPTTNPGSVSLATQPANATQPTAAEQPLPTPVAPSTNPTTSSSATSAAASSSPQVAAGTATAASVAAKPTTPQTKPAQPGPSAAAQSAAPASAPSAAAPSATPPPTPAAPDSSPLKRPEL